MEVAGNDQVGLGASRTFQNGVIVRVGLNGLNYLTRRNDGAQVVQLLDQCKYLVG